MCQFNEEELIQNRPVDIWVKAHVGNSSCASSKRSVVLADTGTEPFNGRLKHLCVWKCSK